MEISMHKYKNIFFVGIKGSGICSIACFLNSKGHYAEGLDVSEIFYTDAILKKNGIKYFENIHDFSLKDYSKKFDLVIYSPAYSTDTLKALLDAKEMNIPIVSYPEVLGKISKDYYSIGIAGSHGKTTTTSFLGIIFKAASLDPNLIVGTSVKDFNNDSFLVGNSNIFIAETCEYKNHFLNFNPNIIVLTNIDHEHIDFFKEYSDLQDAFLKYIDKLKPNGILIINSDEENLVSIMPEIKRNDIRIFTFGFNNNANFIIENLKIQNDFYSFDFLGMKNISLKTPLEHNVVNFACALLALDLFLKDISCNVLNFENEIKIAAKNYKGIKRRVEIVKEANGVIYLDDYGHHPKEIAATLKGLRNFYMNRRIVLDFMPHTFTRTEAFFDDFVNALKDADVVILHSIYLSERENFNAEELSFKLFQEVKNKNENTYFFKEVLDSVAFFKQNLEDNDLFVTMGAGNNFILHNYL